ncbi:sigma-70 family RNA polymerase sigma factor [Pedobacter nutrimenti]|uniref:sigma-70 family RNA polymerase sigma factor n=1 Tax=Pedobacter nutrimenti TaxID=1241337 RepID=UPI0029304B07|nr:sigma-70 family RNA polymerase sigma factor [Pedobacter nutrimenti]
MQTESNEAVTLKDRTLDPQSWVSKHADYLFSYALTRLNDEDMARDLVQETFLSALESANKFEGRSTERTWLTSILKFKVIDVYRKNSAGFTKRGDHDVDKEEDRDFFDAHDGHWNDQHRPKEFGIEQPDLLETKEFQKILQLCMKKLPILWLSVFTMKHMDEEATEIICRELKVSASNFWVIIHRTKVNLRSCLQKNWI